VVLWSDVGGSFDVGGPNQFTIMDGRQPIPDAGPIPSPSATSYRPTNADPGELFPAPAPAGPHGADLASLKGLNPNGAWKLYVSDDAADDMGSLGGWVLVITTDALAPQADLTPAPLPNAAGWYKSNVSVTLSAADSFGGTAVDHVTYEVFGAQTIPDTNVPGPSTTLLVNSEGTSYVDHTATDGAGNTAAIQTDTFNIDKTKPTITAPQEKFVAVTRLPATSIPVTIYAWLANDPDPGPGAGQDASGLDRYWLQGSTDGGAVQTLTLPTPLAPSDRRYLTPGHTYRFQLAAVDVAGNTGLFASGPEFLLQLIQETVAASVAYTGSWEPRTHAYASGGTTRASSQANATATFTFTGTDACLISTRGTDRGRFQVRVDGGAPAVVDLYHTTLQGRRIVFAATNLSDGPHTIEVTVLGTKNAASSGFRVDIDAFAVLNPT
jgi:hypothetical protein